MIFCPNPYNQVNQGLDSDYLRKLCYYNRLLPGYQKSEEMEARGKGKTICRAERHGQEARRWHAGTTDVLSRIGDRTDTGSRNFRMASDDDQVPDVDQAIRLTDSIKKANQAGVNPIEVIRRALESQKLERNPAGLQQRIII